MKSVLIFILGSSFILTGCKKNKRPEICNWSHFTFQHPVSVYPIKESYSIGDTIWFEISFPDIFNVCVQNNYNGEVRSETIQLKDFDFQRTFISFTKLIDSTINSSGQNSSGWNSFEPIYMPNSIHYVNSFGIEYKYRYQNSTYFYKLGLICTESGRYIYNSWFSNNYSNSQAHLNAVDIRPECDAEQIQDIRFPVNKQPNGSYLTNYHLFEQYMNPSLENDINRIKNECFTFVVN